jgi:hypothetical protein
MQRLWKEFFGNRRKKQANDNCEKSSGSDVVHVLKGIIQFFGEKEISLFSDNDNEFGEESVSRGKNA